MGCEKRFWERLRKVLNPLFFCERIENLVSNGHPDVELVCRETGEVVFVELKALAVLPKRLRTPVFGQNGLRPAQVAWLYGRSAAGTRIFILASGVDVMWLVPGRLAREFNAMNRGELDQWAVTPLPQECLGRTLRTLLLSDPPCPLPRDND